MRLKRCASVQIVSPANAHLFGLTLRVVSCFSQDFKSLSVKSEKWVDFEFVAPSELAEWLRGQRAAGYTLVGLEQTMRSVSLEKFDFPEKTVLVLGEEKRGIPANIIHVRGAGRRWVGRRSMGEKIIIILALTRLCTPILHSAARLLSGNPAVWRYPIAQRARQRVHCHLVLCSSAAVQARRLIAVLFFIPIFSFSKIN
jgi:hypothetical protein